MSEIIYKCQVCGVGITEEMSIELNNISPIYELNPGRYATCSHRCLVVGIRLNACFGFKDKLKKLGNMSYEQFQELFSFDEAGGYAQGKYEMMRLSVTGFLFSLDKENVGKLSGYVLLGRLRPLG